jgi:hypothetical protein
VCYKLGFMVQFIPALLTAVRAFFRSRNDTALEILALRQQIVVLKRKRPRPRLNQFDRLFWITLRCPRPCPSVIVSGGSSVRWTTSLPWATTEPRIQGRAAFDLYVGNLLARNPQSWCGDILKHPAMSQNRY